MKITAIESILVEIPFENWGPKWETAGKTWSTLDILFVRVDTELTELSDHDLLAGSLSEQMALQRHFCLGNPDAIEERFERHRCLVPRPWRAAGRVTRWRTASRRRSPAFTAISIRRRFTRFLT